MSFLILANLVGKHGKNTKYKDFRSTPNCNDVLKQVWIYNYFVLDILYRFDNETEYFRTLICISTVFQSGTDGNS